MPTVYNRLLPQGTVLQAMSCPTDTENQLVLLVMNRHRESPDELDATPISIPAVPAYSSRFCQKLVDTIAEGSFRNWAARTKLLRRLTVIMVISLLALAVMLGMIIAGGPDLGIYLSAGISATLGLGVATAALGARPIIDPAPGELIDQILIADPANAVMEAPLPPEVAGLIAYNKKLLARQLDRQG